MKISELFRMVKDSWLMDVRHLTDEQLKYDRNKWIKKFGLVDKDDKYYRKDDEMATGVYTIAILMEQLRRNYEIHYDKTNS